MILMNKYVDTDLNSYNAWLLQGIDIHKWLQFQVH